MERSRDMPVEAPVDTLTYHQGWEDFPELTDREKLALCVVADICRQTLGMPFETHGTMGLTHNLSGDALRELLVFQGDYPALLRHLRTPGARLTARERTFGALTADVLHGVLDGVFAFHISAALAAGASPADVLAVVRFCGQFGAAQAWQGLRAAERLLATAAGARGSAVA
jgi:alkylhydroperoxidase/carboxymuconolactone decarboxylase family protein YurZ